MPIYDISATIREGIAVWPGDQAFRHRWTMRIQDGDSCNVSSITMSIHTGSHVDAPFHFDDSAPDIAGVSLESYLGTARVIPLQATHGIRRADLQHLNWSGVSRVLFRTRASDTPEDRFDRGYAHLEEDAAVFLGSLGLRLVGTDAPSVDPYNSKDLPAHKILLKNGIAILEGIRLGQVPAGDYELICLPLKLHGLDGSPVRAVLRRA